MKIVRLFPTLACGVLVAGLVLACGGQASGQDAPNTNPAERVIYPASDQSPGQQMTDQSTCYDWSTESAEWDPRASYDALEDEYGDAVAQYQSGRGGAVRGAARGALAGLAIGAIAGDAGTGAAIGATAGGLRGGRLAGARRQAAQEQFEEALGEFRENFRYWDRHWSACMDGRGYSVR